MPLARYFLFVGGVLLALLFVVDALVPKDALGSNPIVSSSSDFDKTMVRIKSNQKLPERVVYDTTLPTLVPSQATVVATAAPARELSAEARVRDTFAQFIPPEKNEARKAVLAEAKPIEPQAKPAQLPKKRKIARNHANQPMRLAQPGSYRPYRVAQQQPRIGFFSGFGTW